MLIGPNPINLFWLPSSVLTIRVCLSRGRRMRLEEVTDRLRPLNVEADLTAEKERAKWKAKIEMRRLRMLFQ
ncbi:hypothetical protein B0H19DRAFT_1264992 [Mycena capillaripes]|nr:hypothetical protein B0H19DRAFT_1264992 [Mycena capillaripes]